MLNQDLENVFKKIDEIEQCFYFISFLIKFLLYLIINNFNMIKKLKSIESFILKI